MYIQNIKLENNIVDITDIPGWLQEVDEYAINLLLGYQNISNIAGNILELGVYYGKSFSLFYNYIKNNEYLIGIDSTRYFTDITQKNKNIYNNIIFYNTTTNNILNLKINDIRFCHIDASHEYDDVYNDLKNTYKLVNHNAIIVMDDFNSINYLNIISAFYKIVYEDKLQLYPILITDNKIYLTNNKISAELYYTFLVDNIVKYLPEKLKRSIYIKSQKNSGHFNMPVLSCSKLQTGIDLTSCIPLYNFK